VQPHDGKAQLVRSRGRKLAGEPDLPGAILSLVWDGDGYDRGRFIETLKQ
jgi:hypothetical protein